MTPTTSIKIVSEASEVLLPTMYVPTIPRTGDVVVIDGREFTITGRRRFDFHASDQASTRLGRGTRYLVVTLTAKPAKEN